MKPLIKIWPIFLVAIVVAYLFVDRPLCQFIYDTTLPLELNHMIFQMVGGSAVVSDSLVSNVPVISDYVPPGHRSLIRLIVEWPVLMRGLSPFLLLAAVLMRPGRIKDLLILLGLSILFTFILKNDLKWIFSRDWPLTWIHNNPSWISNRVYGFEWFRGDIFQYDDRTGSFPSGHTAVAFATLLPIGLIYRKALPFCIFLATLEGLFLIVFNYHFLSDVLAGALVGITCTLALTTVLKTSLEEENILTPSE